MKTKRKIKQKILKVFAMCILFLGNSHLMAQTLTDDAITQSVCIGINPYEIVPNLTSTYTWEIIDQATGLQPTAGVADITPVTSDWYISVNFIIPGTYVLSVLEFDANSCQGATVDLTITVNSTDDPTFSYSDPIYCADGVDPTPTSTLPGGSYSSAAGLVIDPVTGVIDLSTSAAGTYTVTYLTTGTCPNSSTESVTITLPPVPYAGPNDVICEGLDYTLSGTNTGVIGNITWITPTGTAASFSDATILNPVYTPTAADISNNTVTLELQISGVAPCTTVSDFITITINATPTPGPIWHN